MKRYSWLVLTWMVLVSVTVEPAIASASNITIRPFLIDETVDPRGLAERTITISSSYPKRKAIVYATVNEITLDAAGEIKQFVSPVMTDRTNTVTSWIEITRARIEVMPGETVEVPLTIRTHPDAEPGEYHVFLGFVEAANRPKAESVAMAGDADGVIVKVTIADDREDSMRISSFTVDRFVTGNKEHLINVALENVGDLPSAPSGEIIFYDSRGIEVTSIPVNNDGVVVEPGESVTLSEVVPLSNELGRFKANINLKYGERQQASLYDTAHFYALPLQALILIFVLVLLIAITVALLIRRAFSAEEETHDDFHEVTMYVRDGHDPQPKDHDIDLKNNA